MCGYVQMRSRLLPGHWAALMAATMKVHGSQGGGAQGRYLQMCWVGAEAGVMMLQSCVLRLHLAGYSAVDRISSSENAAATSRADEGSGRMTWNLMDVCQLETGWE